MKFHVGTSGYSYPAWKGSFYPKDLPAKQMLRFYGEQFGAVEANSSFYSMPKASVLKSWADQVPPGFKFVLKAPQVITHFRRLTNVRALVSQFLKVASALEGRLGALLFQLPPNFKKDVPRLEAFLKLLPRSQRVAFEFRHQSWFDDEVFDVLRSRGIALCIAEAEDGVEVPFVSTADWGYLRMRMGSYSDAELKKWIKRAKGQRWKEAYVFFKHEDEARGPRFARRFLKLTGS